jgi:hypothetical protein
MLYPSGRTGTERNKSLFASFSSEKEEVPSCAARAL